VSELGQYRRVGAGLFPSLWLALIFCVAWFAVYPSQSSAWRRLPHRWRPSRPDRSPV